MNDVSGAASANKQEIIVAEREWADAVVRNDAVAANVILADEFRLTGPELQRLSTGRAATKEVWMQTLPLIDTKSFDFTDTQVTVFGSVAVAFIHATLDWSIQGRPLPSRYRLTDLWVNRDGRWQVLTRVSEPLD